MKVDESSLTSSQPHVCATVLEQLAKDTGYELLPDLLAIFIADLEQRLFVIEHSPPKTSLCWQQQLHPLKSTSATYGAMRLSDYTQALEQRCKQQVNDDYCESLEFKNGIENLRNELCSVIQSYKSYLSQLQQNPAASCQQDM